MNDGFELKFGPIGDDLTYIAPGSGHTKGYFKMASKAIHLKKGFRDTRVTVDQLFEAAFGPKPRQYQHESLLGWRPLATDSVPAALQVQKETAGRTDRPFVPPPGVKVYETEELVVVEVELPAIEKESLHLEISGDLLIIRGNRIPVKPSRPLKNHRRKGPMIYRYIQLPVFVKPGEVKARLEGYTVRVTIAKPGVLDYAE